MKKFLVVVAFIIVAVAAYVAGDQHGMKENGEMGAHDVDPRLTAASDMLVGTWSSEDDRNFQREYKADGTVVDSYASASGETLMTAYWTLFTADMPDDGVQFQLNNKDVYITQTEKDGSKMYFRVSAVTPTELELVNMTKGGGMRFGKMTTGHEMADGVELSLSFNCEDGSSFVAEFPTMDELVTSEKGKTTGTLPKVASTAGQKYENDEWMYVFQGETVKRQHKVTTNITTCSQPFDANNAPFNFGD